MPKKLSTTIDWPTLVQERLVMWGKCIHTQRLRQRITGADLCARLGISRATLRRLEQGSPDASTGAYLTALLALGVADQATPALPPVLWQADHGQRVKLSRQEQGNDDADYF
ncbi:helix-turn-helix domain-containing protein [Noviherbaspirillum suwonense]|jgi:transcriptional regulator with XRE-family HTH domain|uniref:Helix-turn-helix domain-containing protein n=1 Tax=Noviherbaspirillum suwonense TaxID=1224511 RepID=A0ABY1Q1J3_9BURK|nr:helix-turn-helix transcriptional regulator [Noviherbaspirillum suwonense]SMP51738.1 Helix-turn-helix domain-containing protein [Noviherbaspirillum suwonense]